MRCHLARILVWSQVTQGPRSLPQVRGDMGGQNPQFTARPPIAKLLWLWLIILKQFKLTEEQQIYQLTLTTAHHLYVGDSICTISDVIMLSFHSTLHRFKECHHFIQWIRFVVIFHWQVWGVHCLITNCDNLKTKQVQSLQLAAQKQYATTH